MKRRNATLLLIVSAVLVVTAIALPRTKQGDKGSQFLGSAENNGEQMIDQGRQIFRFDTYGDEAFWTDQLQMQQVVNGLTPRTALQLGLKVDSEALPASVVAAIKSGKVNLDDPAVTLQLVKRNAVLGVVGSFTNNTLTKVLPFDRG